MRRAGFTLIELLIVLTVLGVMAMAIIPSFAGMRTFQVSLAAKDSMRFMRYARKTAIQTQRPVTLTFSPGEVRVAVVPPEGQEGEGPHLRLPDQEQPKEADEKKAPADAIQDVDPESFDLTRTYKNVAFAFLQYEDNLETDFRRRKAGQDDEVMRFKTERTFTITVRANGTTRPFSMRVYGFDPEDEATLDDPKGGTTITFDFLCAGTIGED